MSREADKLCPSVSWIGSWVLVPSFLDFFGFLWRSMPSLRDCGVSDMSLNKAAWLTCCLLGTRKAAMMLETVSEHFALSNMYLTMNALIMRLYEHRSNKERAYTGP